jgi:hypothetical protein
VAPRLGGVVCEGRLPRGLGRLPLKLPRCEASDMDVKLIQPGMVAVARELNLKFRLVLRHGQLADRAAGPLEYPGPGPLRYLALVIPQV